MIYGSVCSGIEAATLAWRGLGWRPAFYSEIEAFPQAVLRHHWGCNTVAMSPRRKSEARKPGGTWNFGDFTTIRPRTLRRLGLPTIDILCGGTPCQSFSVAGLRKGLDDDRGNLALEFLRLAGRLRPRWLVWENVPGTFSTASHVAPAARPPDIDLEGGNGPEDGAEVVVTDVYEAEERHAFACFLAGLSELGFGYAYRVLDAQFFGVPQRRRRIVLVGYLGDWRPPAAVLFEPEGLRGDPAPRRETGQSVASLTANGVGTCGADDNQARHGHLIGEALTASYAKHRGAGAGKDSLPHNLIAHALRGEGFDASEDGSGRGAPLVPIAIQERAVSEGGGSGPQGKGWQDDLAYTLEARKHPQAVAYGGNNSASPIDVATAVNAHGGPHGRCDFESETFIAFDTTQITSGKNHSNPQPGDACHPLAAGAHAPAIAFSCKDHGADAGPLSPPLRALGHHKSHPNAGGQLAIASEMAVRRLTPRECERLQGIPDDHTCIPWRGRAADQCPDGPRYKAIGNSWAVPKFRWLGERIDRVDRHLRSDDR